MKQGKVIAVVGAPASGKSTLIRALEKSYDIVAYHEGEESTLPDFIRQNLAEQKNMLETLLWFHAQTVRQALEAQAAAREGKHVLMDTSWLSNWFFLEASLSASEDRTAFRSLLEQTTRVLPQPDAFIYLRADAACLGDRMRARGRAFESNMLSYMLSVREAHEQLLIHDEASPLRRVPTLVVSAKDMDPAVLARLFGLEKLNDLTLLPARDDMGPCRIPSS